MRIQSHHWVLGSGSVAIMMRLLIRMTSGTGKKAAFSSDPFFVQKLSLSHIHQQQDRELYHSPRVNHSFSER